MYYIVSIPYWWQNKKKTQIRNIANHIKCYLALNRAELNASEDGKRFLYHIAFISVNIANVYSENAYKYARTHAHFHLYTQARPFFFLISKGFCWPFFLSISRMDTSAQVLVCLSMIAIYLPPRILLLLPCVNFIRNNFSGTETIPEGIIVAHACERKMVVNTLCRTWTRRGI